MNYTDLAIFGVYLAPIVPMLLAALLVTWPLLRLADHLGITRHVWHPSLFDSAVYVIVLSLIVVGLGRS
jgi:hypothetical protein